MTYPWSYIPFLPALPAICLTSLMLRNLLDLPSNFFDSVNIILLIGRFTPIPIASVHTTILLSPFKNLATSAFRTLYGSEPYITLTLYPSFFRRVASIRTFLRENATKASPSRISSGNMKSWSSTISLEFLLCLISVYVSPHIFISILTICIAFGDIHTCTTSALTPRIASVHAQPLSESATICASSITQTSKCLLISIFSTVQDKCFAPSLISFSSPVVNEQLIPLARLIS